MKKNMIKQRIVVLGLAYSMAFIGGCTSGSEREQKEQPLQVEASIVFQDTRAFDGTNYDQKKFAEGDEIGINKGDDIDAALAKTYVRSSSKWTPKTSDRWAVTGSAGETFSAYYPLEYTEILADQTTSATFWQSNLLKADGVAPQGNVVTFTFHPIHSKVTLNITYPDTQTPGSATVSGTDIIASGNSGPISLYRTSAAAAGNKHSYTGIVKSGISSFSITVTTTPGGTKTYNHTETNYLPGRNYIFNFNSKDELILNGVTVASFTQTGETDAGSAM